MYFFGKNLSTLSLHFIAIGSLEKLQKAQKHFLEKEDTEKTIASQLQACLC